MHDTRAHRGHFDELTVFPEDFSLTRAPKWFKGLPTYDTDRPTVSMALASLGFPHVRDEALDPPIFREHKALHRQVSFPLL